MDRRQFFTCSTSGMALLFITGATAVGALVRFLYPGVYDEPPQRLKIGYPGDFAFGPTFLAEEKIYVFRDDTKGFSAASAVCPHLGCTVQYVGNDRQFSCPCHGSVFDATGKALYGPASRPLEWLEVTLAKDGQLQVDGGRKVPDSYSLRVQVSS